MPENPISSGANTPDIDVFIAFAQNVLPSPAVEQLTLSV